MRRIQLNSVQLNAVRLNGIGEYQRDSYAGAPPVVPDVPDIPDIPEEPDVPSDPDVDENGYIKFADPEVARICAENWGDGTGITESQVKDITDIGSKFAVNSSIKYFDEFEEFTEVTFLGASNSSYPWAFSRCTSLQRITLPKYLYKIYNGAQNYSGVGGFYGCSSLSYVGNIENLKDIGAWAFGNCTSLQIDDLSLPNLENLGQNAFYGVKIKKISDLGKLTTLPSDGPSTQNFGDKDTLEEIVLPQTITTIPRGSFYKYTNAVIEDLNLPNLTSIGNGAFNSTKLRKISSLGAVTRFADAAGNVGETFENCKELTRLADGVLDNITYMAGAFKGCSNLEIEELRLPSLTGVLTGCFSGCKIKKILDLGTISEFYGASTLIYSTNSFGDIVEEIVIPNTVTSIGRYAFTLKPKLSTIVILASTPPALNSSAFSSASTTSLLYVPDASVEKYKTAANWSAYADRILPLSQYNE